jgi:hypothetical protein
MRPNRLGSTTLNGLNCISCPHPKVVTDSIKGSADKTEDVYTRVNIDYSTGDD